MARTLIANGYVVSVDPSRNIFPNGFVAIDGFDIVAVGAAAQMPPRDGFEKVIDADGCIVLPGLINMHQHHWYTLFKGLADGYLLEDWVANFLLPLAKQLGPEAMRISNAVAAMEMLATGTTCSFNHSVTTTDAELLRTSIEPQCEIGIRQVYGKELRCKTPGNPNHPLTLDEALSAFEEEYRRWHGAHDGLSRFGMVIESNAHWVAAGMSTEELICRGYELAKKLGLRISTHIAGGGGIAPAANAVRAGVNVALGTDGPMVDYSVDMVEQMKACMLMQHVRHLDPTRISTERALEMATINAAKALGLENEIGSLEAGKRAEIAVFDLRKPYVGVLHRPLSSFICAGKGNDARAVIVNGKIAYQDGKFPRCSDRDRLFAEAERIGVNLVEQAGLSHRFVPAWRS
jgi:cytosine/adenosine deaminase-related metal-dependent hydrolase